MLVINNLTKTPVNKSVLQRVAKIVLSGENIYKEKEISVIFVNSEKIKELNLKYRKKDKATDVLSFEGEGNSLGEIVICLEEVKKNARDFKKEIVFVLIHGILHLLGYKHEESEKEALMMESREKKYLNLWQGVK